MQLVDDDKIVVSPIHAIERDPERLSRGAGQIGVAQDVVVEAALSSGDSSKCILCRALMARPKLLMLNEPSMGLAPQMVAQIFRTIESLKKDGTTILFIEQNAKGL